MRYPLWAFLFVFLLPPFALHAALAGKAGFEPRPAPVERLEPVRFAQIEPIPVTRHAF
ncbi:hypothetical protein OF122_14250 [Pelagibacterium flavum]|uniref:Uncharacterized protein n=1 Tax=Pelagibacterium flavum TaxID=2984530 RepID=A0ABY6IKT5_9HYPH|nr:hypothetical protein [Pelagibacterium sp. YIM 151497]UYQ71200.1 hypothetical protein OF122_14250 [Pelagibacterium sp. YIM 151497]